MRKMMSSGSKDLINELPDSLLCHVLSFLSTKEAASTSVLSKTWRYLLAFVRDLDFDDSVYLYPKERVKNPLQELGFEGFEIYVNGKRKRLSTSFPDFVDRILDLQGNFPVQKFSLKLVDDHDPVDPDCVVPWIHNVLKRGVLDMHLVLESGDWESSLPSRIFMSKTLVRLRIKIGPYMPNIDVKQVHLPKLKSLYLESVMFEKQYIGFNKLISGCPVLEELFLEDICSYMWGSFSVSVATLKRLTFIWEMREENPTSLLFDTPNLAYLEYTEVVAEEYLKVNFDSLVEAKIDLRMTEEESEELRCRDEEPSASRLEEYFTQGNATEFIMGMCNVRILYLSANSLEAITFCCKSIPIFRNLVHLTIESNPEVGWESLPGLITNCSNLETLVFEGLLHRATSRCGDLCLCKPCEKEEDVDVSTCLSSSTVKVLKILKFGMEDKEMEQVKYFLKTMPNLEQLIIHYDTSIDEKVVEVLCMVPREGLTKCKIQVISENPTLSSST